MRRRRSTRAEGVSGIADVDEATVVIAQEAIRPVAGEVDIRIAVSVDVPDRRAHSVAGACQPPLRAHLAEAPAAVVLEEEVRPRLAPRLSLGGSGRADPQEVEVAISVEVEEGDAGAHAVRHEVIPRHLWTRDAELETRLDGGVDEEPPGWRRSGRGVGRPGGRGTWIRAVASREEPEGDQAEEKQTGMKRGEGRLGRWGHSLWGHSL